MLISLTSSENNAATRTYNNALAYPCVATEICSPPPAHDRFITTQCEHALRALSWGDTLGQVRAYTISTPVKLCGTTTHGEKPMTFAIFPPHDHGSMSARPCFSRAHYLRHLWLITVSCSSGTSIRLDTTLCVTHPSTPRISRTSCGPSGRRLRAMRSNPRCSEEHWA